MIPRPTVWTLVAIVLALAQGTALHSGPLAEDPNAVTLPLDLEINGSHRGEVIVRASPSLDAVELEGSSLRDFLADRVSTSLADLVDSLPDGFHPLESFRDIGLEIELDLERLVIAIQIQERSERSGPQRISLGYQRPIQYENHAPQARLSGYANLRLRARRSEFENSPSRDSYTLGASHVLNLGGFALEGQSVLNENDGFSTRNLTLVKDFPQRLLRLKAGDVSTPITGLQQGQQIFGLNLAKEFGIQPYRTFTPTSSASFQLEESSTIRVSINGRPARTLQLEPGSYSIEEFKLAAGSNNMELEFETESGLVDRLNVSEFGAAQLLDSGVSTFSISAGWPHSGQGQADSFAVSDSSWYQRHVEKRPIYSAYARQGLSNQFTLSADAQGSSQWGRIGAGLYTASALGSLSLDLSHHHSRENPDALSYRLSWERELGGYRVRATSSAADRGYQLTRPHQPIQPLSISSSHSFGISRLFSQSLNVSIDFLQQKRQDGTPLHAITSNLGRRFNSIYASLSLRYSHEGADEEIGGYLSLTWNPARKWRARSLLRSSDSVGGTAISTSLDYANRRARDYLNARIDARYSEIGYEFDTSFSYENDLYSASFSHNEVYDSIDGFARQGRQTSLSFDSAIAFADGSIGFANKIRNSFAIVDRHRAWRDVTLGINPTIGGYEKLGRSKVFSPVIGNLNPYREGYATIQTVDSDYFLERNDYYFFPGYRRGTKLTLGDDAIYSLRSTLVYSDNEPVKYKAIQLVHESGEKVNTFTNSVGRFMATGLKQGRYTITAANSDETTAIEIQEGETQLFLERIQLATP